MTTISASIDLQLGQYGGLFGRVGIYGWKPDQADLYVFRYPGNTLVQYHDADYAYEDRGEASGWGRARTQRVLGTGRERALFKIAPLDTFRGAVCPLHWGTYEMREVAAARIRAGNGPPPECRRADFTDVVALANGPPLQRLAFVWAWEARAFAKDAVRSLLRRGIAVKVITVGALGSDRGTSAGSVRLGGMLGAATGGVLSGEEFIGLPTVPEPINWWTIAAVTAATVGMVYLVTRK